MIRTTVALIPQKGYVGIGVEPKRAQLYFPYITFSSFCMHSLYILDIDSYTYIR